MVRESLGMSWGTEKMTAKHSRECSRLQMLLEPHKSKSYFPNMGEDKGIEDKVTFTDLASSDAATFGKFTYASFCAQVRRIGKKMKSNDERKQGECISICIKFDTDFQNYLSHPSNFVN